MVDENRRKTDNVHANRVHALADGLRQARAERDTALAQVAALREALAKAWRAMDVGDLAPADTGAAKALADTAKAAAKHDAKVWVAALEEARAGEIDRAMEIRRIALREAADIVRDVGAQGNGEVDRVLAEVESRIAIRALAKTPEVKR